MIERFEAVARRANIDFEAWFSAPGAIDRSWELNPEQWHFRYRFLKNFRIGQFRLALPEPLLNPWFKSDLIISLYDEPGFLLGWLINKVFRRKTAFWVVTTFDSWVRRKHHRDAIKKFLFRYTDQIFVPGPDAKGFAVAYGAKPDRIILLKHSIDYDFYSQARSMLAEKRNALREKLGLSGTVFIYVGRIWSKKGLDTLFLAFSKIIKEDSSSASLLVLGDGQDEDRYRMLTKELKIADRVVFTGFIQKEAVVPYFAAADAMVFPTLGDPYGLVIDEALAAGLPVISSSSAGEVSERIVNGKNGFIVPPNDIEALRHAMQKLTEDHAQLAEMKEIIARTSMPFRPDDWAEALEAYSIQGLAKSEM